MDTPPSLIVLFYRDRDDPLWPDGEGASGRWIAHLLNWDVVGAGRTRAAALSEMLSNSRALLEVAHKEGWHQPGQPAEKDYWTMLAVAEPLPILRLHSYKADPRFAARLSKVRASGPVYATCAA